MSPFNRGTVALAFLCASLAQPCAKGTIIAYEGFVYPANSNINGTGDSASVGFADNWQVNNDYTVATGSLASPAATLLTSGNALAHPKPVQGHILRTLAAPFGKPGTTAYISFLLRPDGTLGGGGANGYFGVYLQGTNSTLFIGKPGSAAAAAYDLEGPAGNKPASSKVTPAIGQTVLIVVRADFAPGNDTFKLFMNPAPGSPEPASPDATKSDLDLGTITQVGFDATGAFTVDELRIGTSLADVTPVRESTTTLPPAAIAPPTTPATPTGQPATPTGEPATTTPPTAPNALLPFLAVGAALLLLIASIAVWARKRQASSGPNKPQ